MFVVGGGFMPIKIDIQTNFTDQDMTIESCSQIIEMLQNSYKHIRDDIYTHFFSMKHLRRALMIVAVMAFLYFATEDKFFVYMMPISVLITMVITFISAEMLSKKIRSEIQEQIEHFNQLKNRLLKEKINA